MSIPIYVVNAFTSRIFGGNPAAVMPLEAWLSDKTLQALAAQNNLSETAFLVPVSPDIYELRWFTPGVEVELCGHATLASAHVLRQFMGVTRDRVLFRTRFNGELVAAFTERGIELDFPAFKAKAHVPERALVKALGVDVVAAVIPEVNPWKVLYEVASEQIVKTIQPDFAELGAAVDHAVIVTARGHEHDFVSRVFAPHLRVNEDPVTGSAHCVLAPYWAEKLGKTDMTAAQLSSRGGELRCSLIADRVKIFGLCQTFSVGEVIAPLC